MRPNAPPARSPGLSAEYSLTHLLLAALTLSLAIVAGSLAAMYPQPSAMFLAGGAVFWVVTAVANRLRRTPTTAGASVTVSAPATDR